MLEMIGRSNLMLAKTLKEQGISSYKVYLDKAAKAIRECVSIKSTKLELVEEYKNEYTVIMPISA